MIVKPIYIFQKLLIAILVCAPLHLGAQSNQSPLIFADTSDEILLIGLVRNFDFSSPTTTIEIEVEGSAGQQSIWHAVTLSATELRRYGWTSQSLFEGELVQVSGTPVPGSRLTLNLDKIVRANGQSLLPETTTLFDDLVSGTYEPIASQGSISISYDHYGFSKTTFYFNTFDAELQLNADDLSQSSFQLDLLAEDIASGSSELTRLLKSGTYFHASDFPLISVRSLSVEALEESQLLVLAEINIKGITHPAQFEITLNANALHPQTGTQAIGFAGRGQILRSSWGFLDFIPDVSDEVWVEFQMEFGLAPEIPSYLYNQR